MTFLLSKASAKLTPVWREHNGVQMTFRSQSIKFYTHSLVTPLKLRTQACFYAADFI